MHIERDFKTDSARNLIMNHPLAKCAYHEIVDAIRSMVSTINNSEKNCNGGSAGGYSF